MGLGIWASGIWYLGLWIVDFGAWVGGGLGSLFDTLFGTALSQLLIAVLPKDGLSPPRPAPARPGPARPGTGVIPIDKSQQSALIHLQFQSRVRVSVWSLWLVVPRVAVSTYLSSGPKDCNPRIIPHNGALYLCESCSRTERKPSFCQKMSCQDGQGSHGGP